MESVDVHCVSVTPAGRELADRLGDHERLSISVSDRVDERPDTDVVVVEHAPPDVDAVAAVASMTGRAVRQPVVVFAPEGSERLAGRAVRAGATDYWTATDVAEEPIAEWLCDHVERDRDRATVGTERERRLEALLAAGDELHDADSVEQVCVTIVETAEQILDLRMTGVWMRADDRPVLEPVAISERSDELVDRPTFHRGESLAWSVHETGETRWLDRVDQQPGIHNESTPIRSEMLVPLGDWGVLVSGSLVPGAFDATDVRLVELLATNAEAALRRTERERELTRQNERLDRFVSIASHDLRNPLAVAKSSLEVGRETGDDDHFATAAEALDRTERLLADLRRLAREGESVTETQRVELSEIATDAWSTADVGDAGLKVTAETSVSADPSRLRQLLENLLHNAATHARTAVSVTVGDFDGGFYVADDGPGIPPDQRERVFDPGVTTVGGGTGFGLAIVREIAAAHGWSISVTESAAGGARFEVRT